jgi:hypothetical protein
MIRDECLTCPGQSKIMSIGALNSRYLCIEIWYVYKFCITLVQPFLKLSIISVFLYVSHTYPIVDLKKKLLGLYKNCKHIISLCYQVLVILLLSYLYKVLTQQIVAICNSNTPVALRIMWATSQQSMFVIKLSHIYCLNC